MNMHLRNLIFVRRSVIRMENHNHNPCKTHCSQHDFIVFHFIDGTRRTLNRSTQIAIKKKSFALLWTLRRIRWCLHSVSDRVKDTSSLCGPSDSSGERNAEKNV